MYVDPVASSGTESILLGGLFPISRSSDGKCGVLRKAAVERAEGMVFAIHSINNDSSILPRVNLSFDIRDSCSIANIALENSIEYVQHSDGQCANVTSSTAVSGVVGASSSRISASTASFFRLFQIPQISYSSTAALLSDSTVYDYFFRTVPSDVFQARAMADLIENFNWTYIFALYSDDTYGQEGIASLLDRLQRGNSTRRCVALQKALPHGSTDSDFYNSVVQEMKEEWVSNASVAVLFGHLDEAIAIMDAILRDGRDSFLINITWIASDSWARSLPDSYHQLARGMLGFLPHPRDVPGYREYFNSLNPTTSSNPWFRDYWELVFNCSSSVQSCIENNLSNITTSSFVTNVVDAVYAFAHALDHMILDHCSSQTLCDAITTTRPVGRVVKGSLLREYLYNVSFPSTFSSGSDLLFDSNGDVRGSYLIINLQLNSDSASSFETVGTWNHSDLLQLTKNIQWSAGSLEPPQSTCSLPCQVGYEPRQVPDQEQCCWTCEQCLGDLAAGTGMGRCFQCQNKTMPSSDKGSCVAIPLTYFTWSSPWAITILILTCIGMITVVLVGAGFIVFRQKQVIKASSRELSALILFGVLLSYVLPFLFVARPTAAVCGIRRFAIGFCFAISYSALLVRTNRIHRIFNQRLRNVSRPPRFISPVSQIVLMSIFLSVQVLIAVLWLAAEQPSIVEKQVDSRTVELRCGESPYFGLSVSLIYNLFLLLLSTYFAFLTRKVPDNFNEAKYINITVYSLCIVWVGFLPAYFVSIQFGTVYENFFLLLAVFLSASITLLCLLVPKVFVVFLEKRAEKTEKSSVNMDTKSTNL